MLGVALTAALAFALAQASPCAPAAFDSQSYAPSAVVHSMTENDPQTENEDANEIFQDDPLEDHEKMTQTDVTSVVFVKSTARSVRSIQAQTDELAELEPLQRWPKTKKG